jgi:hypothetical protein
MTQACAFQGRLPWNDWSIADTEKLKRLIGASIGIASVDVEFVYVQFNGRFSREQIIQKIGRWNVGRAA